jgi:anti-anti-sigma regulatory factor
MRRILATRRHEYAVALLTAVAVVGLGVEYGIIVAIIASIVDHLRHSYNPLNSVLVKSPEGHWHAVPVGPGARTAPGLVVYRFGTSLYYANAARLAEDIAMLVGHGPPLRWLVLDFAAIGDVDYTASTVLSKTAEHLHQRQIRLAITSVLAPVQHQLDRYGISVDASYDTPGGALEAFENSQARLVGRAAAADVVDGASGEAHPVRSQEGDQLGDLLRTPDPLHRDQAGHVREHVRGGAVVHRGGDDGRGDGVDQHTGGGQLLARRLGQADDRGLGCRIDGQVRVTVLEVEIKNIPDSHQSTMTTESAQRVTRSDDEYDASCGSRCAVSDFGSRARRVRGGDELLHGVG